jgi:serine/threonine protein phosphatase PrpC
VHGVLEDGVLGRLLGENEAPAEAAAKIVNAALARGARDNCTAVVATYRR